MEPRPFAFHKMEALVKQMQDPESGVPVRSQKIFLTSIPSAFMGYDLVGWLMEHLNIEESGEAVHLANQLCQYGYLFPVTDCKSLNVKDDNSLYRFQAVSYWPWHHKNPDNVEYAIYLMKRTLRNKQRHALEDYEQEAFNSLKKNLQNKWGHITAEAEEQIKQSKDKKKMEKLVADSHERAYWRVHRPPPGNQPPLEPAPISTIRKQTTPPNHNSPVEILKRQLSRSKIKVSQAVESLVTYYNTYVEYDTFLTPAQPSNPWLSDDTSFWQFNHPIVEVPTEKRVKKWALSIEDLLADPTGVEEFTNYLRKEYSHENIRFWLAVKELRSCAQSQVPSKVLSIYEEFLVNGAPCEINIDSKTLETTRTEMKTPSRFTFDIAAHHVYNVLLNKDCYPRFIRSDQYKNLLANAIHPPTKKRFFGFGGGGKKKGCGGPAVAVMATTKRRGSDRSLTGVVHEAPVFGSTSLPPQASVPLSSSQANLHEISRDSGVSPERIIVPKPSKSHSFERKPSSEDERARLDECEPGPSFISRNPSENKEEPIEEPASAVEATLPTKLSKCTLGSIEVPRFTATSQENISSADSTADISNNNEGQPPQAVTEPDSSAKKVLKEEPKEENKPEKSESQVRSEVKESKSSSCEKETSRSPAPSSTAPGPMQLREPSPSPTPAPTTTTTTTTTKLTTLPEPKQSALVTQELVQKSNEHCTQALEHSQPALSSEEPIVTGDKSRTASTELPSESESLDSNIEYILVGETQGCSFDMSQPMEPKPSTPKLSHASSTATSSLPAASETKDDKGEKKEPTKKETTDKSKTLYEKRMMSLQSQLSTGGTSDGGDDGKKREGRKMKKETRRAKYLSEDGRKSSEKEGSTERKQKSMDEGECSGAGNSSDKKRGTNPQNPADICPWEDDERQTVANPTVIQEPSED